MSYPSGSTLLVVLQNGASPNTGPFDIYINDLSSSTNLIANDVSKATLSGSGYTFVTPLETFRVWAKSDSTITNADVAIVGEVPGLTKTFNITGSYDSSLSVGQLTADVFCDAGYGMQIGGNIPSNLNTCPSTVGIGTASISPLRNTLITVKTNESSSNYIKFFPNGAATSVYYYHVPCSSSSGTNETSLNICVDLAGNVYQTVATNSINVYPSSSELLTMNRPANFLNSAPYGNDNSTLLIKVNGSLVYSGSSEVTNFSLNSPGNAIVEVTSSIGQSSLFNTIGVRGNFVTNSLNIGLTTTDGLYTNQTVFNRTSSELLSGSSVTVFVTCSFIALPGAQYNITANQYGNLIYAFRFDGAGSGFATRTAACGASTGGPTYYSFWASPSTNNTVYYTNIGMSSAFNGGSLWYPITNADGGSRLPLLINNSGLVTDFQGPC
jgi:hypothetical protein